MNLTITLAVASLEETASFYRDVLRMNPETRATLPGHPPFLLLTCGGTSLLFRDRRSLAAMHPTAFADLDRRPKGIGISLEFEVADLARIRRELAKRERHLLYELTDDESGWQELWLHDPDGYLLVLSQAPPSPQAGQTTGELL